MIAGFYNRNNSSVFIGEVPLEEDTLKKTRRRIAKRI